MVRPALDWTQIRSFLAVAQTKSLSAAARELDLTQPTLGRHIDALERALGAKLFTRSVHGLTATEAALDLVPHAQTMAATAAALERTASGEAAEERGTVRVTASEIVGAEVLPAILGAFRAAHPSIALELVLSNRTENLLTREADIAVRMIRPAQRNLVARKIGDVPIHLYAHKSYAKRRGLPKTLTDLSAHDVIGYDGETRAYDAYAKEGVPVTRDLFALRTDSDLAQLALLRAGAGIGGMQKQLAAREKDVVPVLPGTVRIPLEMWLVTHEDLRTNRRIRLLYDWLAKGLGAYVRTPNSPVGEGTRGSPTRRRPG
jgi:DNA-binding transcriptional LysR family regulator